MIFSLSLSCRLVEAGNCRQTQTGDPTLQSSTDGITHRLFQEKMVQDTSRSTSLTHTCSHSILQSMDAEWQMGLQPMLCNWVTCPEKSESLIRRKSTGTNHWCFKKGQVDSDKPPALTTWLKSFITRQKSTLIRPITMHSYCLTISIKLDLLSILGKYFKTLILFKSKLSYTSVRIHQRNSFLKLSLANQSRDNNY